jgi:UDP-N-acetylmuramoyl-L-alanyl-D-glutamate--2,6-diaminopimelate ligase
VVITSQKRAAAAFPQGARYVHAVRVTPDPAGLVIAVDSSWGPGELTVRLIGDFNVDNVLTVLAVLLAWNVPLSQAIDALEHCRAASGRMEMFGGRSGVPLAIVDYAHTPDALEKALHAARLHCRGALRVVFGCGGDRDAGKRPLMGGIAASLADDIIVTDDNPRTEDPTRIVAEIVAGIASGARMVVEHDRAAAIRMAVRRSTADDVVLVAGKGHEDYQIYGTVRRSFSDQAIIGAALESWRA